MKLMRPQSTFARGNRESDGGKEGRERQRGKVDKKERKERKHISIRITGRQKKEFTITSISPPHRQHSTHRTVLLPPLMHLHQAPNTKVGMGGRGGGVDERGGRVGVGAWSEREWLSEVILPARERKWESSLFRVLLENFACCVGVGLFELYRARVEEKKTSCHSTFNVSTSTFRAQRSVRSVRPVYSVVVCHIDTFLMNIFGSRND
ncbi:hypothetical protein BDP27DRAFT_725549 [Rhodocollybia butyracea]|uniref:Uncharacterized protein n=1 Tax=Rhodocollybia butyracea TaxID=206335 RepID=A0A9P5PWM8_9AGAR|nr:hypothetical protein BDP27DRAFT_725549 [Rhodocollybia butyracea]